MNTYATVRKTHITRNMHSLLADPGVGAMRERDCSPHPPFDFRKKRELLESNKTNKLKKTTKETNLIRQCHTPPP